MENGHPSKLQGAHVKQNLSSRWRPPSALDTPVEVKSERAWRAAILDVRLSACSELSAGTQRGRPSAVIGNAGPEHPRQLHRAVSESRHWRRSPARGLPVAAMHA